MTCIDSLMWEITKHAECFLSRMTHKIINSNLLYFEFYRASSGSCLKQAFFYNTSYLRYIIVTTSVGDSVGSYKTRRIVGLRSRRALP